MKPSATFGLFHFFSSPNFQDKTANRWNVFKKFGHRTPECPRIIGHQKLLQLLLFYSTGISYSRGLFVSFTPKFLSKLDITLILDVWGSLSSKYAILIQRTQIQNAIAFDSSKNNKVFKYFVVC